MQGVGPSRQNYDTFTAPVLPRGVLATLLTRSSPEQRTSSFLRGLPRGVLVTLLTRSLPEHRTSSLLCVCFYVFFLAVFWRPFSRAARKNTERFRFHVFFFLAVFWQPFSRGARQNTEHLLSMCSSSWCSGDPSHEGDPSHLLCAAVLCCALLCSAVL